MSGLSRIQLRFPYTKSPDCSAAPRRTDHTLPCRLLKKCAAGTAAAQGWLSKSSQCARGRRDGPCPETPPWRNPRRIVNSGDNLVPPLSRTPISIDQFAHHALQFDAHDQGPFAPDLDGDALGHGDRLGQGGAVVSGPERLERPGPVGPDFHQVIGRTLGRNGEPDTHQLATRTRARLRRNRSMLPITPKPMIIVAQLAGSGTAEIGPSPSIVVVNLPSVTLWSRKLELLLVK